MVITVNDPAMLAQLRSMEIVADLQDPDGKSLGLVVSKPYGAPLPGYVPPISDEEIARRRKTPDYSMSLDEFWKKIKGARP